MHKCAEKKSKISSPSLIADYTQIHCAVRMFTKPRRFSRNKLRNTNANNCIGLEQGWQTYGTLIKFQWHVKNLNYKNPYYL